MRTLVPFVSLCAFAWASHADIIAQWRFNSPTPDGDAATGTTGPSIHSGSAIAATIGGVSSNFASGDNAHDPPSTDNSGWQTAGYPSAISAEKTAGVRFDVDTTGYQNLSVSWYERHSATASRYLRFQYTLDGFSFTDLAGIAVYADSVFTNKSVNLSSIAGAADNPNFGWRLVTEFESAAVAGGTNAYVATGAGSSYGGAGSIRFDLVTLSGTVIPGANTAPTISTISNQTIRVMHPSAAIPFNVGDAEDPPGSLVLNKASSDPSVIPEGNITFGGAGADRTVTVTGSDRTGSATITLYVIDTGGRSNSVSFLVTVLVENTAPVISVIPPTNTVINTATAPIAFQIYDLETASADLTLQASSTNTLLLPGANIQFGGSGSNRTVTLTPAPGRTGVAPLSITVSDGTNTATSVFALMVRPAEAVIFYDPFNYPDGSAVTNSGLLWDNRSGVFGQCQLTNNQLLVVGATGEDVVGALAGGPYARSNNFVLYAAFKARFLSLPKAVPGYFAHFVGGSSLRGRVYAGTTNAVPGLFRLAVANGSDTTEALPMELSTNVTYTVVTRYAVDTASTTLWVNPASESDPNVSAIDPQSSVSISDYAFRQDSSLGATVLIDELKVGLSFAAVTGNGGVIAPVPLGAAMVGGKLVLSWNDPGFSLQTAPTVTGVFTNIPGAVSPYTNAIAGPARFFRLRGN
jgi:hypothetical protein